MVELDELQVSSLDFKVVGSVMSQVIDEVSCDKSEKYRYEPAGCSKKLRPNEIKEAVEEKCEGNTGRRRHHQAGFTHRL
jgi:hypothetical protein